MTERCQEKFDNGKAENDHASPVHDSINLPSGEQKPCRGVVTTELQLWISDAQYRPDCDDGAKQVCHQDVGRIESWKAAGQTLRRECQQSVHCSKRLWCGETNRHEQVVLGAGLDEAPVMSGLNHGVFSSKQMFKADRRRREWCSSARRRRCVRYLAVKLTRNEPVGDRKLMTHPAVIERVFVSSPWMLGNARYGHE